MQAAGLALHAGKTKVVDMAQAGAHFDFLGYRFWRGKAGKVRRFVRPKSRRKLHERIKPLTKRNNGHSLEAIVAKLNPILRGWYGYFRHASADALGEMDGWVRENRPSGLAGGAGSSIPAPTPIPHSPTDQPSLCPGHRRLAGSLCSSAPRVNCIVPVNLTGSQVKP
jgi:hypothetical protein